MDRKEGTFIGRLADMLGGVAGRVIVAALLVLIAFELSRLCYSFGRSIFYQDPMETAPGTDIVVTIPEGSSTSDVADILMEKGLIRDEKAFTIQEELYEVNVYPGEYTLNSSMTTKEILAEINISEEEYQQRLAESEAREEAARESEASGVIGGGDEADILAGSSEALPAQEETQTQESDGV